jgi:hypothetical protein
VRHVAPFKGRGNPSRRGTRSERAGWVHWRKQR